MSADLGVKVRGANRLATTLRKAGADVAEMKDANQRAGAVVAAQAKVLAPKRTGRLAGSIKPSRRQRGVQVRVGIRAAYPGVQNYGSAKRNIRPKYYMQHALASKQAEAVDIYFAEMERLVSKVQGA